ncbi:MAG: hypothetical protein HXN56_01715 [Prevotella nigrescens]|nr:hypothetical protein [Prevotella nigrescens]MBF1456100.1 hypothetical protein [Prevotella nigrescens]
MVACARFGKGVPHFRQRIGITTAAQQNLQCRVKTLLTHYPRYYPQDA